VALDRQPPALDRVGQDHGRPVGGGVRLPEGGEQVGQVVAAEVADRRVDLRVLEPGDQVAHRPRAAARARQALAQLGGIRAQQPLVLLVAHAVDAPAQVLPARPREQLAQQAPVLHRGHAPARGLEHPRELRDLDVGDHPVQGLAVDVDDPQDLAEAGDHRVDHRLPDRALVELGVAHERDLPPPTGTSKCPAT
jgi:hypothetical protein